MFIALREVPRFHIGLFIAPHLFKLLELLFDHHQFSFEPITHLLLGLQHLPKRLHLLELLLQLLLHLCDLYVLLCYLLPLLHRVLLYLQLLLLLLLPLLLLFLLLILIVKLHGLHKTRHLRLDVVTVLLLECPPKEVGIVQHVALRHLTEECQL